MDERLIERQVRHWGHNPRLLEAHLWHLLHQHVLETYGIDMDAINAVDAETAPNSNNPLLGAVKPLAILGIVAAVAALTITILFVAGAFDALHR